MKAFFVVDSHVVQKVNTYSLILTETGSMKYKTQDIHYVTGINIHFSTKNMFGPVITTIINAIPE